MQQNTLTTVTVARYQFDSAVLVEKRQEKGFHFISEI